MKTIKYLSLFIALPLLLISSVVSTADSVHGWTMHVREDAVQRPIHHRHLSVPSARATAQALPYGQTQYVYEHNGLWYYITTYKIPNPHSTIEIVESTPEVPSILLFAEAAGRKSIEIVVDKQGIPAVGAAAGMTGTITHQDKEEADAVRAINKIIDDAEDFSRTESDEQS